MRDINEFEKLKQNIDADIPFRLDTTLDRCFSRAESEKGVQKIMKIGKAIAFSLLGILSASGVAYAAATGGFAKMFGNSEKNAEIYSEYIAEGMESAQVGDFKVSVESFIEDEQNGMGAVYCSIENTNPDSDYVLCLYTSGMGMKHYATNDKAKKYVNIATDLGNSSMYIDESVTTDEKQYFLLTFSYVDSTIRQTDPVLEICECDEFGDGLLDGENHSIGLVELPKAKPVEKKVFRGKGSTVIELSPISIKYTGLNMQVYDDLRASGAPYDTCTLEELLLTDTELVSGTKKTSPAGLCNEFMNTLNIPEDGRLEDVSFVSLFTCIFDSDSVDTIVLGKEQYTCGGASASAESTFDVYGSYELSIDATDAYLGAGESILDYYGSGLREFGAALEIKSDNTGSFNVGLSYEGDFAFNQSELSITMKESEFSDGATSGTFGLKQITFAGESYLAMELDEATVLWTKKQP